MSLNGCDASAPNAQSCKGLVSHSTEMLPFTNGTSYFPQSLGKPSRVCSFAGFPECYPIISEIERDWYPKHWAAAKEPSLYEMSLRPGMAETEILRFTWLRTFHEPVIIRITKSGTETKLQAKKLSGKGGYDPGEVAVEVDRTLSISEQRELAIVLGSTAILTLEPSNCDLGTDGSEWIVESVRGDDYRFIKRWSPEEGRMREFGLFMIKLTGWDLGDIY